MRKGNSKRKSIKKHSKHKYLIDLALNSALPIDLCQSAGLQICKKQNAGWQYTEKIAANDVKFI